MFLPRVGQRLLAQHGKRAADAAAGAARGDDVVEESRVADPFDSARIFQWLICETCDDKGNVARLAGTRGTVL